jgi:uncharacterized protein with PIN domain
MNLDARAFVAVMRKAPGYEQIIEALADDDHRCICATAVAEAAILLGGARDPMVNLHVSIAIRNLDLTVVPFTESDWRDAVEAYGHLSSEQQRGPTLGQCLSGAITVRTGSKGLDLTRRAMSQNSPRGQALTLEETAMCAEPPLEKP